MLQNYTMFIIKSYFKPEERCLALDVGCESLSEILSCDFEHRMSSSDFERTFFSNAFERKVTSGDFRTMFINDVIDIDVLNLLLQDTGKQNACEDNKFINWIKNKI